MYYEKKRNLVSKKHLHYDCTLNILRFTDTIRGLVKQAQDVKRNRYNCSCIFYNFVTLAQIISRSRDFE